MQSQLNKPLVFVSSRLRGNLAKNIKTAEKLCQKVLLKGRTPFAPHVYFTRFLDDNNEVERKLGIESGLELLKLCDEMWVFDFDGISSGMQQELDFALGLGKKIVYFKSEDELRDYV